MIQIHQLQFFIQIKYIVTPRSSKRPHEHTLSWGGIIRFSVALSAVLHQKVRAVPGHADYTI